MKKHHFNRVTLLVTHYNRSRSLEHLLKRCNDEALSFEEIVVSDDGSRPEHMSYLLGLQKQFGFRLITTQQNKGLGNNINKGQDAVKTPYTLYVQEDFEPTSKFATAFWHALELMDNESWAPFPHLKPHKHGFSEMVFKSGLKYLNHLKFRIYSDHPHLRRSNFFSKFDRYVEGQPGDPTEYDMCLKFISKGGRALLFSKNNLFLHENGPMEPNTIPRDHWKTSKFIGVKLLRSVFLLVKVIKSTIELKKMEQSNGS